MEEWNEKIIATTLLFLLSTSLFAQGAKTGFIIGATIGGADASKYDNGSVTDHRKTQFGLIAGVTAGYNYALTQNISLGVETGYSYGYNLCHFKLTV